MKITFVIHGKLKRPSSLKNSIERIFREGFEVSFLTTDAESGAKNQVIKAIEQGAKHVIIAGGDGSINEGINGYMQVSDDLKQQVIIGVLPMGTGNDFAKSLNVSSSLLKLKSLIQQESILEVDVCNMEYVGKTGQTENRYYINISDIGIGGFVAENVGKSSKILGSNLTYVKAIVSSFMKYKKQPIELNSPEFNWEGEILSLCMANGKYFGSGMCVAPDALLNDGLIQLTIMADVSLGDYVKNLSKLKRGEKVHHPEVTYTSVSELSVSSKGVECPIDMDGEFIGYTPIKVNVIPKAVKMISKN